MHSCIFSCTVDYLFSSVDIRLFVITCLTLKQMRQRAIRPAQNDLGLGFTSGPSNGLWPYRSLNGLVQT